MKYLIILAFCLAAATAFILPDANRLHGENGWYVPKRDGSFEWIDLDEAEQYLQAGEKIEGRFSTNPVTFILYTNADPSKGYEIEAKKKSIDASPFNPDNPTRITIHGWTSSKDDYVNTGVRTAWLERGDYNMITVDWGRARSFEYASSVLAVPGVGKKVADLVDFLVQNYGMKLSNLELIGHSLGAHVAGHTGKNIKSGKVHTIVGLDPALPLFSYDKPGGRLSPTDADYVESIHSNGGKLGFLKPIGKGAFYPNGGKSQPGCGLDITGSCSHSRSITYYVEAVEQDNFATVKCADYEDAVAKKCGTSYSSVRMAAPGNAFMVSGQYYVPVNKDAPFGKLA